MQKVQIPNVLQEVTKKVGKIVGQEQFDLLNIQLTAGEEVPAHSVNNTAIVIVRRGEVLFNVEGEDVLLIGEDVLIFAPDEMHSLKAITEVDLVVIRFK